MSRGEGWVDPLCAADEAEILTFCVHPDDRRQGIGHMLLRQAKMLLQAQGVRLLHLEVAEDQPPAIALYKQAGFTSCGLRRGYYKRKNGQSVDALLLNCRLV
ncbi:MAG: GNAT family N-acetyltransferase [Hyphomicrobiales bacterium]|nr:GNAT family N-acetyltransferase [Hyphomicrobiales bacterium]